MRALYPEITASWEQEPPKILCPKQIPQKEMQKLINYENKILEENNCKLPQKQYGLKVDEMFNFKIVTDEKESIYAYADCGHFKGV